MKYLSFFVILFFLYACEEETIFPEGSEKLPGIYQGGINGIKDSDNDVKAIVKYIGKNRYTIEIKDCDLWELAVFEIEIYEAFRGWIKINIVNEECSKYRLNSHFKDYHGSESDSYIALKLSGTCRLQEKYTGIFTFSGIKYY